MKKIVLYIGLFIVLIAGAGVAYNAYQSKAPTAISTNSVVKESSSEVESSTESSSESLSQSESTSESAQEVMKVPNLTFGTLDGETANLHDLVDRPTLINVWASWCPPCREEMPYFDAAYEKYKDEVQFLMVNATNSRPSETKDAVASFVEEMGYHFPIYLDEAYATQVTFGVNTLPTTIGISKDGEVLFILRGMIAEENLNQLVDAMANDTLDELFRSPQ